MTTKITFSHNKQPKCLHDDCVTLEVNLDKEMKVCLGTTYPTGDNFEAYCESLYSYLEYLDLVHEKQDCAPFFSLINSLDTLTYNFTIYCCGRDNMTRRQQVNRERFFSENQSRVPTLVTIEGGEFLEIDTPYNRDFIDTFKATVSPRDRYWDKTSKRWGIRIERRAQAVELINRFYGSVNERTEAMDMSSQITKDSRKLVDDAVAKAKMRLIQERGPGSIVI